MAIRFSSSPVSVSPNGRTTPIPGVHRQVHEALPGGAVHRPAAFLRRSGGAFRLRYRALRRNPPDLHPETRRSGHARHPPPAVGRDRRRRQPSGKLTLVVHAEPGVPGATRRPAPVSRTPRQAALMVDIPAEARQSAAPVSVFGEGRSNGGAEGQASTSPTATSCRSCCPSA